MCCKFSVLGVVVLPWPSDGPNTLRVLDTRDDTEFLYDLETGEFFKMVHSEIPFPGYPCDADQLPAGDVVAMCLHLRQLHQHVGAETPALNACVEHYYILNLMSAIHDAVRMGKIATFNVG